MVIDKLKDKWICSCGNWVDRDFYRCSDCCEEKLELLYNSMEHTEYGLRILN